MLYFSWWYAYFMEQSAYLSVVFNWSYNAVTVLLKVLMSYSFLGFWLYSLKHFFSFDYEVLTEFDPNKSKFVLYLLFLFFIAIKLRNSWNSRKCFALCWGFSKQLAGIRWHPIYTQSIWSLLLQCFGLPQLLCTYILHALALHSSFCRLCYRPDISLFPKICWKPNVIYEISVIFNVKQ